MHTCTCSEFCTLNAHTFDAHVRLCDSPHMILVRHRYTATVLNMTSQRWLTREVCLLHSPCCAVGVGLLLQYALTHSLTHSNYSSHICVSHSIVHTWPHHARHNQITSRHDTSHHITSHHITSHHITSRHITSHHITSHHISSHHITSPRLNTQDFVSDVDRSIWWHYIAVITPNTVAVGDRAMMYVVHFGQAHMHLIFSARQTTFMATFNTHTHTHTHTPSHTLTHTHTHTHTHAHTHTHTHIAGT
jgi:hypothetical protein